MSFSQILEGPQPAAAVRALDQLGALPYVMPDLLSLKNVPQSPPHVFDVWTHTLAAVQQLETILTLLGPENRPEMGTNILYGDADQHPRPVP